MDTSNKNDKTVNVSWPKVDKRAWLEESVEEHFHCVLCGSELEFTRKTNFIEQTVVEDAHCPSCGVRNRQSLYGLQ